MNHLTGKGRRSGHRYEKLTSLEENTGRPRIQRPQSAWLDSISLAFSNLGAMAATSRAVRHPPPGDPTPATLEIGHPMDLENAPPMMNTKIAPRTPAFAVHAQTLIPLGEALSRDDIRRRQEGFELAEAKRCRRKGVYLGPHRRAVTASVISAALPGVTSQVNGLSALPSFTSTRLSIYSTPSWDGFDAASFEATGEAEVTVLFDADASSMHQRLCDLADLAESSFDEEAFLQMAAELGW